MSAGAYSRRSYQIKNIANGSTSLSFLQIYENMHTGDLEIETSDTRLIAFGKKVTRLLLLSAFAMEVMSIFVTTVTGTMLKSRTIRFNADKMSAPLAFLRSEFEFEYLTARICFLQGLLNWIAAIALGHAIPTNETPETRRMNKFVASFLLSTICMIISFYNNHLTFYSNYTHMLIRWLVVAFKRYVVSCQPMACVFVPLFIWTSYLGFQALFGFQIEVNR